MFAHSHFNGDISNWDVRKVGEMIGMFRFSDFRQDISGWRLSPNCDTQYMWQGNPID